MSTRTDHRIGELSIGEYIEALTPEENHGDRMAVALLRRYLETIHELEARLKEAEPHSTRYYYFKDKLNSEQMQAQAVGFIAMCYQGD